MKRKKRRSRSKADIITAFLYVIFVILVAGVLFGIGRGVYALMGETVGNHYYAKLAKKSASGDAVDFAALTKMNPEVRAWVRLPNTAVNLPIVKTSDNEFYLDHLFNETKNKLGTPFIDAGNVGDFTDRHTVIYGHALMSGSMFGSLWEYENPNYFMRNPEIQLFLPDGTQKTLAVFACSRVEGVRAEIPIAFADESAFLSYIDKLLSASAFSSNVKITSADRIVSFCVVLPDGGTGRLLLSCKLMDGSTTPGTSTLAPIAATSAPENTQAPEETPQG